MNKNNLWNWNFKLNKKKLSLGNDVIHASNALDSFFENSEMWCGHTEYWYVGTTV